MLQKSYNIFEKHLDNAGRKSTATNSMGITMLSPCPVALNFRLPMGTAKHCAAYVNGKTSAAYVNGKTSAAYGQC